MLPRREEGWLDRDVAPKPRPRNPFVLGFLETLGIGAGFAVLATVFYLAFGVGVITLLHK